VVGAEQVSVNFLVMLGVGQRAKIGGSIPGSSTEKVLVRALSVDGTMDDDRADVIDPCLV
jgi:hypothetical protein